MAKRDRSSKQEAVTDKKPAPIASSADKATGVRSSVRFTAEMGTMALIQSSSGSPEFTPNICGLVLEESFRGCRVAANLPDLRVGHKIRIKVGQLGVMDADIRWAKRVDPFLVVIGVQFLDK